jgi:chromosome segregation ATPase
MERDLAKLQAKYKSEVV